MGAEAPPTALADESPRFQLRVIALRVGAAQRDLASGLAGQAADQLILARAALERIFTANGYPEDARLLDGKLPWEPDDKDPE